MKEVIILGGGLAGWSLFEHLVAAGHRPDDLCLIEKGVSARGASGVLQGMLHPFTGRTLYPKAGALEAWQYSRDWLLQMQEHLESPADKPFYTSSMLWRIAMDTQTAEQFERSHARAVQEIPDYPVVPLLQTDPLQGVVAGYAFSGAGHVNLQRVLAAFQARYAASRFLHQQLRQLCYREGLWQVETDQHRVQGRHVVLAVGHELLDFFPHLPLRTKRGEVICFQHPRRIDTCVSGGGRYLVPLHHGAAFSTYIGGATFYPDRGLWPPTQAWKDLCERFHWFPDIEQGHVTRVWSGVRATLHPDREPLCGPVPEMPGLWLMSAFSTRGLLQIPRHAKALAHCLTAASQAASQSEGSSALPVESLPARVEQFKFLRKAKQVPFARAAWWA